MCVVHNNILVTKQYLQRAGVPAYASLAMKELQQPILRSCREPVASLHIL